MSFLGALKDKLSSSTVSSSMPATNCLEKEPVTESRNSEKHIEQLKYNNNKKNYFPLKNL